MNYPQIRKVLVCFLLKIFPSDSEAYGWVSKKAEYHLPLDRSGKFIVETHLKHKFKKTEAVNVLTSQIMICLRIELHIIARIKISQEARKKLQTERK